MGRSLCTLLLASLIACAFGSTTSCGREATSADVAALAFVDVSVIPMGRDEVRPHQTVLVAHDRIIAMGPTDAIRIPNGATRISGRGRYLMPGLVDMHAHFQRRPSGSDADPEYSRLPGYNQRNQDFAVLFVANGVTSVRQMHGHSVGDELSAKRSDPTWIGPTLYSTGPITDGDPPDHPFARIVVTPEDAARAVAEDRAVGRSGIKVYSGLSVTAYDAIVAEAAKARIDVVGHIPDAVGLEHAIESHQATIEHVIDSFLWSLQPPGAVSTTPESDPAAPYRHADLTRLGGFADALRRAGIWTCPTIVVARYDSPDYSNAEEFRYLSPAFTAALRKYWSRRPFEAEVTFALSVVKVLHEHGAGLLLGSDSFIVVPGFSAVQELDYLVQAGLTPYEAMRTGTVNAARALHEEEEFGTVEIGKRADLVLLDANPLVDIRNVRTRVGVVLRGRWLPESELRDQLSSIERRVASGAL